MDGYKFHAYDEANLDRVCLTLFSAPNYCDVYNNRGAILQLDASGTMKLETFI